jgi:hypothetical protein
LAAAAQPVADSVASAADAVPEALVALVALDRADRADLAPADRVDLDRVARRLVAAVDSTRRAAPEAELAHHLRADRPQDLRPAEHLLP